MGKYKKRKTFLTFGSPLIEGDEIKEVVSTLKSSWIGTGPKVARFEEKFSSYIGSKYAVALNSCTAALHLSMLALGIGKGDEVIMPVLTFCATANAVIHAGAKPVFVDVNPKTYNISVAQIKRAITKKTKAILPVHFAGRACDMTGIQKIARKHKLFVINDAAHAIESEYKGKKIGALGDITCYSFYVTKNLVTSEGGMITTNNKKIADNIKVLALHGMSKDAWSRFSDSGFKHYDVVYPGFKYNMTDIAASLGVHQLNKINKWLKRRKKIWDMYDEAFKDLPVFLPEPIEKNTVHSRHLYTLLIDIDNIYKSRDRILNDLMKENIGTGVHYRSLHLHKYYKETYKLKKNQFPNALYISDRTLSLPLSPKLRDKDVFDVIEAVKKVVR